MKTLLIFLALLGVNLTAQSGENSKPDTIKTSNGELIIHFLGHGSMYFEYNKLMVFIDPFSKVADYSILPKADLILVTHTHHDHLDSGAIVSVWKSNTKLMYTAECARALPLNGQARLLKNGDVTSFEQIKIEAVPAYNIVGKRPDGNLFHPKGEGNGYILTFGNTRLYIAGDTENIPEMKTFGAIDIAFLPMNLPYTMTPEQMADAATMVNPKILYPYHFGETDVNKLVALLSSNKSIEIRVREMK
jgi:L-ascorbate metabolism protein UlaG (beta-lactamase superfamily)